MNDVISVIVPVYNVAEYLSECIDRILGQDYEKLEVILIDDGSTDDSGAICDEYAARDYRVRVIHQKNSGAGAAKNAGLRAATGEYLSFVDSDDFLEPGAYSYMIGLLEEFGADAVQCAFRDVYRDKAVDRIIKPGRHMMEVKDYLASFPWDWTCGLLWDKLYRRKLFHGIFFEEGHKIDDEYFTYQGIMNAHKVVRDDHLVYNYRKRRSSVMYSPESGQRIVLDRIDFLEKRRKNVSSRYPSLRRIYDTHFLEMMVILSMDSMTSEEGLRQIRGMLRGYFREKGHTAADIRLWPALLRLRMGLVRPSGAQVSTRDGEQDNYFT